MVAGVGDIEIVVCVERNSVRTAEQCRLRMVAVALIARRAALASDGTESAVVVNGADAVIEGIGEKDTAIGVDGDVARPLERDVCSWCAFICCAARRVDLRGTGGAAVAAEAVSYTHLTLPTKA